MNVKIAVSKNGLLATYSVDKIDETTFNARLKTFSGSKKPPAFIKFYRTESGWSSAFQDAALIGELGAAVESTM